MIVLSVTVYCLNTLPELKDLSTWINTRSTIDIFCMCWFTLEFAIRVMVCPDRKAFVQSVSNWIDFLSVIPSYLKLFSIQDTWLINLVIIRLLRLFRFFKLSYGLQVLLHTLKASFYELVLLLLILSIPIVIFSSLVHTVETNMNGSEKFISIPATFWWCLITMTSVGYGDMVPETWAGKIVGGICAICGVLIVALPISVIGSNFSLYYAHVRARLKLPSKDRKLLAGNIRGLLKQPLSLSSRERDRRGLKRNNMPAIRRKGSSKISYKNETEIQVSRSESSGDESLGETSMNAVNSSEECLDWDFSADSKITFRQASSGQQRRNQRGNRREAVTALLPGSDSDGPVPYEIKKHKVRLGKAKGVGNVLLNVPEHDNTVATIEQSSLEDNFRNLVSSLESDKSSVNDDCDLFTKEDDTCLADNAESEPAPRRCSSTRGSSRRASMKLMDLNVLPDKCENKIQSNDRRRKETITSIDEPFSHQHKKKKIKSKRLNKLPDAKTKNSVPSFGRRRRDGIFTLDNMEKRTYNGYLTDSSERDGSPVEPPGLNCSPASPAFENLPNSDMAVLLGVPNSPHLSSNEKIPGELILKLNSLALCQDSVDGPISKDEAGFGLKCKEKRKLSGQSHIVIKHLPRNLNITGRNLHKTRKISRSESNLRTYYRVFNDIQKQERLPSIRHYASHSDVRLLESGV